VDPDLDPNVIRREAHETQDSVEPPEAQTLSPPQLLSRVRKFPRTLSNLLLNESNMKVGRIDRRRRVVQITEPELEPAIVREEGNLPFSTIGAAQSEVGLKEPRGGVDIRYLKINVLENDG